MGEEDAGELRAEACSGLKNKVIEAVSAVISLSENQILSSIDRATYLGGTKGRYWCLDPIDGTKGFLRGDQYAVALALIEDGEPVLGVMGCPNLLYNAAPDHDVTRGCLFVAVKGAPAVVRPLENEKETIISVTSIDDPARASFCEPVEFDHTSHSDSNRIANFLGIHVEPHRLDSQCKYAVVARGDASIYLRLPKVGYEENVWDHAAGWRILKQAGGEITDVRGNQLDFSLGRKLVNNLGVVATNGKLHQQVIAAVRQILQV